MYQHVSCVATNDYVTFALPSEPQSKKIRKVPPGLPSSVSHNIQKCCSHVLCHPPCTGFTNTPLSATFHIYTHPASPFLVEQQGNSNTRHTALTAAYLQQRIKENRQKKPHVQPVTHLQRVFIVCCICRPCILWPHFFPSAK